MLELKIKAGRRFVDPTSLASRFGAARALEELGDMIEYLIAQVDILAGDPEAEEIDAEDSFVLSANAHYWTIHGGAGCPVADAADTAYPEWHTMRGATKGKQMPVMPHEDDEEDDPGGQCDEDGVNTRLALLRVDVGPGCDISDADHAVDDRGCDEEGDCEALPILDWRAHDQSEAIRFDPGTDRRIMGVYRDRIRQTSYIKMASSWPGKPPVWRPAGKPLMAINTN